MKNKIIRLIAALVSVVAVISVIPFFGTAADNAKTHVKGSIADSDEKKQMKAFADELFGNHTTLPFSFCIGDKSYSGFDSDFKVETADGAIRGTHKSGLVVTVYYQYDIEYCEIEWYVTIKNTSDSNSEVISSLNAVDIQLDSYCPSLTYQLGDTVNDEYSLATFTEELLPGMSMCFDPCGGKSTGHQRPYYRLYTGYGGISLALGWQGRWFARFESQNDKVRVTGGQYNFSSYLEPGETVETPSVVLIRYSGNDKYHAINMWRRWFYDCAYFRDPDGNIVEPRTSLGCSMSITPNQNEENMINQLRNDYANKYYDLYWIDAGWYFMNGMISNPSTASNYWQYTGTWRVDTNRFPTSFRAVRKELKDNAVILLWFEPERVRLGTELFNEDDYTFSIPGSQDKLIDYTNPKVVSWMANTVNSILDETTADIYRQDFNFDPYTYWTTNDAKLGDGRDGITENKYIQGLMDYYSKILAANPEYPIDMCASGGMRNDISVMRFSINMTLTDTDTTKCELHQNIRLGLNEWFSNFSGSGSGSGTNYYSMFSNLSYFTAPSNYPYQSQVSHLFCCDYYPLTEWTMANDVWVAYEFYDTEYKEGCFVVMRREDNPDLVNKIVLKGLNPEKDYTVLEVTTGKKTVCNGNDLMTEGFQLWCDARDAKLYKITENGSTGATE